MQVLNVGQLRPVCQSNPAVAQVINRAKLQRAGKDNLFVRLLYGKDAPRKLQSMEEQERLGKVQASCYITRSEPSMQ